MPFLVKFLAIKGRFVANNNTLVGYNIEDNNIKTLIEIVKDFINK